MMLRQSERTPSSITLCSKQETRKVANKSGGKSHIWAIKVCAAG